jgi:hypothetical protein
MTDFWNLSDNTTAATTGGQFETGGGDIEPIPSNTSVLAVIDEAKVDEYQGERFVSLRWVVLQPKEYTNRKVFQKVRVWDGDSKKSDKAKRMLAAIDTNAGGKLLAAGGEPSDESLTVSLVNKPMVLKLQLWEMDRDDGTKARGNWVSAVSPRSGAQAPAPVAPPPPAADLGDFGADVPF